MWMQNSCRGRVADPDSERRPAFAPRPASLPSRRCTCVARGNRDSLHERFRLGGSLGDGERNGDKAITRAMDPGRAQRHAGDSELADLVDDFPDDSGRRRSHKRLGVTSGEKRKAAETVRAATNEK